MKIGQFIRLARVSTLAATAVPLMVGAALGLPSEKFDSIGWLNIFIVALLMQIATNALNEYGDYRKAIDTVPGPGFAGLIVSKEVPAREVLLVAVACYAVAFVLGINLVLARGILMLLLGVVAILVGIVYSEGPRPVSSTPFGEALVAVVMGPIEVVAANLAVSGEVSNLALVYSIPVSLMVAAILLTNNLRDLDKDRDRGRRTLAVVIGKRYGSFVFLMLILFTFLWSFPAFLLFRISASIFFLWLAFPLALKSYRRLMSDGAWPKSVAIVARLHVLVGALLTLSILFRF